MSLPPESGSYYGYSFPSNDIPTPESTGPQRQCTVRGCRQVIEGDSPNKMCEVCRGKHRIYASTKRARRKLEKAAVGGKVVVADEEIPGSVAWMSQAEETEKMGDASQPAFSPSFSVDMHRSPSPPPTHHPHIPWAAPGTIDPRLFPSSSSSELAGALTLPPSLSRPSQPREITGHYPAKKQRTLLDGQQPQAMDQSDTQADDLPPRFCSVKGCRIVIAASYPYKMCGTCRDRYRHYGITKRRKWKAERVAFEQELDSLLEVEEARRCSAGLPTLADNAEELFKWQQSVVDEKVSLPENSALTSGYTDLSEGTAYIGGSPAPNAPMLPVVATTKDLSTLPPHMCTVSHCHKVLPGTYPYKRCEQHRVQNRHHSQLKRVREKVVKTTGPPEGAVGESFGMEVVASASGSAPNNDEERDSATPASNSISISAPRLAKKRRSASVTELRDDTPMCFEGEYMKEKQREERKQRTYNCTATGCYNLVPPGNRWRMCDSCRATRKAIQAKVKAQVERELRDEQERAKAQTPEVSSSTTPAPVTQEQAPGDAVITNLGEEPIEMHVNPQLPREAHDEQHTAKGNGGAGEPTQMNDSSTENSGARFPVTGFVEPSMLTNKPAPVIQNTSLTNASGYQATALTTTFTPTITQTDKPSSNASNVQIIPDVVSFTAITTPAVPPAKKKRRIVKSKEVPDNAQAGVAGPSLGGTNVQKDGELSSKPSAMIATPTPPASSMPPYAPYAYGGQNYPYPYYMSPYGLPPPYVPPSDSASISERPPSSSGSRADFSKDDSAAASSSKRDGKPDPLPTPPPTASIFVPPGQPMPPPGYPPYTYPYPYTPYGPYSSYYPSPYGRYIHPYPYPPPTSTGSGPSQVKRRVRKPRGENDQETGMEQGIGNGVDPEAQEAQLREGGKQVQGDNARSDGTESGPSVDGNEKQQARVGDVSRAPEPAQSRQDGFVKIAPRPPGESFMPSSDTLSKTPSSSTSIFATTLGPAQFPNGDSLRFRPSSYNSLVTPTPYTPVRIQSSNGSAGGSGNPHSQTKTAEFIPYDPANPKRSRWGYKNGERMGSPAEAMQNQFSSNPATGKSSPGSSSLAQVDSPVSTPIVLAPHLMERTKAVSQSSTPAYIPSASVSTELLSNTQQQDTALGADPIPEPISVVGRSCAGKSCHRTIPTGTLGNLCDKCRMRIKKHQSNAKKKFKLEPKRLNLTGSRVGLSGKEGPQVEGTPCQQVDS